MFSMTGIPRPQRSEERDWERKIIINKLQICDAGSASFRNFWWDVSTQDGNSLSQIEYAIQNRFSGTIPTLVCYSSKMVRNIHIKYEDNPVQRREFPLHEQFGEIFLNQMLIKFWFLKNHEERKQLEEEKFRWEAFKCTSPWETQEIMFS